MVYQAIGWSVWRMPDGYDFHNRGGYVVQKQWQDMKLSELRQHVQDWLTERRQQNKGSHASEADLSAKYYRMELAEYINDEYQAYHQEFGFRNKDYRPSRQKEDYSSYRVTQVLGLGDKNRIGDMRPNEIYVWSVVFGVSMADLIEAGAGMDALSANEVNQLLSQEGMNVQIVEAA